jgi:hypothetical protein
VSGMDPSVPARIGSRRMGCSMRKTPGPVGELDPSAACGHGVWGLLHWKRMCPPGSGPTLPGAWVFHATNTRPTRELRPLGDARSRRMGSFAPEPDAPARIGTNTSRRMGCFVRKTRGPAGELRPLGDALSRRMGSFAPEPDAPARIGTNSSRRMRCSTWQTRDPAHELRSVGGARSGV